MWNLKEVGKSVYNYISEKRCYPLVGLTKLELKILNEIKKDSKISLSDIEKKLNISRDTVKEYISRLKKKKVLERIGKTSKGYWKINYKFITTFQRKDVTP